MKKVRTLTAATLLAMASCQAFAADDNVDIVVTGEIIPPACVPTLSGGATFDYGTIASAKLAKDDFTILAEKSLTFSVVCSSPTKVAFKTTDARAGSVVVPAGKKFGSLTAESLNLLGLGQSGTTNIGSYEMNVSNGGITVDGAAGYVGLRSADNGSTWAVGPLNCLWFDPQYTTAVARSGTTTPVAFTTMTGTLKAIAALNKGSELDLTTTTDLDGLATIQLVYL
ncbi:DUF1120 domain-containing protein [Enterobacter sp. DRP3]|nr:DUF1120 domain-containing protein [Enterobacter sp. DRP3]